MTRAKELAREIADELFTNGLGEVADRLVCEVNGKDRGGYCRESVQRIIAAKLGPLVSDTERNFATKSGATTASPICQQCGHYHPCMCMTATH